MFSLHRVNTSLSSFLMKTVEIDLMMVFQGWRENLNMCCSMMMQNIFLLKLDFVGFPFSNDKIICSGFSATKFNHFRLQKLRFKDLVKFMETTDLAKSMSEDWGSKSWSEFELTWTLEVMQAVRRREAASYKRKILGHAQERYFSVSSFLLV